jgi:L-fuconate dehydratase
VKVTGLQALDLRFPLPSRAGSDAHHPDPVYSFATCVLSTDDGVDGTGYALTLGRGNELVTQAISCYEPLVVGVDVASVAAEFGAYSNTWSNESQLRWVGPQKGVTHLALAAVLGAIVDLWAKAERKPLWRLLLDLSPKQLVRLVDFSTIDDVITPEEALTLLEERRLGDEVVAELERCGYPAYDTSVGWLGYSEDDLVRRAVASVEAGYTAVKLKIGSAHLADDVKRMRTLRVALGDDVKIMVDANQRWGVGAAIDAGRVLAEHDPYWLEEPVHPDDVLGYADVARGLAPMRIAGGEHLSNQVLFKNFIRAGALHIVQPDAVRLAGLPEYLAVSLMAAKHRLPALPHVGDMGQVHQHLVVFTHVALGMEKLPLEMIPHLASQFAEPCQLRSGRYLLPKAPGASTALTAYSIDRHRVGVVE